MGQGVPGPGGLDGPLGTIRRWFLRGAGGEKTSRLLRRKGAEIFVVKEMPGRCFRHVPSRPPGLNKGLHNIFLKG